MRNVLHDVYGPLLVVRPPVPVTVNKAEEAADPDDDKDDGK